MRVGVYQNNPGFGEVEANVEKAIKDLDGAETDLMVLPELFNTGYQFISREEALTLAEEIPVGKTCHLMGQFARERNMVLVFGLVERDGDQVFNTAAIFGPAGFVGRYRKTHLFADEKGVFDPGNSGFKVHDIGKARIGVMICFDWWFPESARILALLGADIICHPANLVLAHCQRSMSTRSLENGLFSATANRVGQESRGGKKPLRFTGGSQVLDCSGDMMVGMGEQETGVAVAEIDVSRARDKKITPQNDRFGDRRPEFYGPLILPSQKTG
ncbi:nitrilase-related carbon-nitrogen hydrolase [Thermodesulfobacteriota bacterium]